MFKSYLAHYYPLSDKNMLPHLKSYKKYKLSTKFGAFLGFRLIPYASPLWIASLKAIFWWELPDDIRLFKVSRWHGSSMPMFLLHSFSYWYWYEVNARTSAQKAERETTTYRNDPPKPIIYFETKYLPLLKIQVVAQLEI